MISPDSEWLREHVALLVMGRMGLHWPLRCPMCPDDAAMALDIADTLLAASTLTIGKAP